MALKLQEIQDMTIDELIDQYKKSSIELVDLRMKFISRQLEDYSQLRKKKKEIARILTVHTEKIKDGAEPTVYVSEKEKEPKKVKAKKEKETVVEEKVEEKKEEVKAEKKTKKKKVEKKPKKKLKEDEK